MKPTRDQIVMAGDAIHEASCPEGLTDYGCSCSDWTDEAEPALEAVLTDIEKRIEARIKDLRVRGSMGQASGMRIALGILRGES